MAEQEPFGRVLAEWRARRRLTKQALADAMGFDRSYISHVEAGRHHASADFARKAEAVLNVGGEVWTAWMNSALGRGEAGEPVRPVTARGAAGLVVEHDHAELRYDGHTYAAAMRRTIVNTGPDPVTRYLIRISVDRHPGDVEASNRLYRANPLTFDELDLAATCDGEPMTWQIKLDRDSFKEVWLCFENDRGPLPPLPRPARHPRLLLPSRRRQMGPVVPARRTAADHEPVGPPRFPLRPGRYRVGYRDLHHRRSRPAPQPDQPPPRPGRTRRWSCRGVRLVHHRLAAQRPLPARMAFPRAATTTSTPPSCGSLPTG
jgi:transcriptional regulator with XRE-family HTH domain